MHGTHSHPSQKALENINFSESSGQPCFSTGDFTEELFQILHGKEMFPPAKLLQGSWWEGDRSPAESSCHLSLARAPYGGKT